MVDLQADDNMRTMGTLPFVLYLIGAVAALNIGLTTGLGIDLLTYLPADMVETAKLAIGLVGIAGVLDLTVGLGEVF